MAHGQQTSLQFIRSVLVRMGDFFFNGTFFPSILLNWFCLGEDVVTSTRTKLKGAAKAVGEALRGHQDL